MLENFPPHFWILDNLLRLSFAVYQISFFEVVEGRIFSGATATFWNVNSGATLLKKSYLP